MNILAASSLGPRGMAGRVAFNMPGQTHHRKRESALFRDGWWGKFRGMPTGIPPP